MEMFQVDCEIEFIWKRTAGIRKKPSRDEKTMWRMKCKRCGVNPGHNTLIVMAPDEGSVITVLEENTHIPGDGAITINDIRRIDNGKL